MTEKGSLTVFPPGKRAALAVKQVLGKLSRWMRLGPLTKIFVLALNASLYAETSAGKR